MRGVEQRMQQLVPAFLQQHQAVQEANLKSKEAFFTRWPQLKGRDQQVLQVAEMYRKMNPNASVEDRLENVGKMVCAALGLPVAAASSATPSPTPTPTTRQPFRPASTASSGAGAAPPSDNYFEQEADSMLQEEGRVVG